MNWDDLRFFLELARKGSVSGAGRSLGVKHTTVARRIRALEQRLGARLFDRSRAGYAMTQAAENMYERAVAMETLVQAVDREVFGRDAELTGPLKITAAHDVADLMIVPQLPTFREAYPYIDVLLIATAGLVDLAAREADIAVRLTSRPPDYLVGREVVKMRHGIYGTERTLKSLSAPVNVILFRGDPEQPEWVSDHFPDARTALRVDDVTSMAAAVRSHLGLARLQCFIGDSHPDLRRLDLPLTPSDWGVWVLSHIDLRASARVRACRQFLIRAIEQQRPLIQGKNSRYF